MMMYANNMAYASGGLYSLILHHNSQYLIIILVQLLEYWTRDLY